MSLFGGASGTGGGLFGGTGSNAPSTTTPTSNLFGTQPSASSGLFGSTQPTSSLTSSSLFGGANPSTANPAGGSLFGGNPTPASTTPTSGLFGATTTAPGTGLFGGTTSTTAPGSSLFGATTTAPGGGMFGSSPTNAPSTTGLFNTSPISTANGLFGPHPNLQPQQPQQPQITESTKYSELTENYKNILQSFNVQLNQRRSTIDNLSNNKHDFTQLLNEIDQIASNIESLSYSFNYNIQAFRLIEETLMRPLSSVNIQFNLLSTAVLTSFQQQQLPSREMESIVDELVQKLERIKSSLNHILPHYSQRRTAAESKSSSIQQSFISTLDNNQRIIQSEAIYLANVLKDLERLKKAFLDYKAKKFQDTYNPFKYYRHLHHQELKKQNESILTMENMNNNYLNSINGSAQNSNVFSSASSVYGGSGIFSTPSSSSPLTGSTINTTFNPSASVAPAPVTTSLFGNPSAGSTAGSSTGSLSSASGATSSASQTTSLFGNPTSGTTSQTTSLFGNPSTTGNPSSTGTSLSSGASSLGSSFGSTTSTNPTVPSLSLTSVSNPNFQPLTSSLSSSSLITQPKTPILSSQSQFNPHAIPGLSISNDTNFNSASNRLSLSSSSIGPPRKR